MINHKVIVAGSYSISIAAAIGLVRLPKLHKAYHPFIAIATASLANEIVSHILILFKKSNAVAINIFGLFDAILWIWQFRRWNRFEKYRPLYHMGGIVLMMLWIIENIAFGKLFSFGSVYPIALSFSLVLFSIIQLTRLSAEKDRRVTASILLICCGVILFYTYRIFIECVYAPVISKSESFLGNVFIILSLVNLIVNIVFALAVIWIPGKQRFSLPFY